jgi:hypothetical protein
MAREPHYPEDAPIADPKAAENAAGKGKTADTATAARPTAAEGKSSTKKIVAGAAIGIGSAAIVAALLYANRRGKGDKGQG